jgi:hypothetical protein
VAREPRAANSADLFGDVRRPKWSGERVSVEFDRRRAVVAQPNECRLVKIEPTIERHADALQCSRLSCGAGNRGTIWHAKWVGHAFDLPLRCLQCLRGECGYR